MSTRAVLSITGWDPIIAELVEPIGEDELMHIRGLGDLLLILPIEVARDLADAIIEAEADRAAAVQLIR